jgi:hypothetical protein
VTVCLSRLKIRNWIYTLQFFLATTNVHRSGFKIVLGCTGTDSDRLSWGSGALVGRSASPSPRTLEPKPLEQRVRACSEHTTPSKKFPRLCFSVDGDVSYLIIEAVHAAEHVENALLLDGSRHLRTIIGLKIFVLSRSRVVPAPECQKQPRDLATGHHLEWHYLSSALWYLSCLFIVGN